MGFLDKAKAAAEQAAARAKEGVQEVQTKRELSQAFDELGRAVFELVEEGKLAHPQLDEHVEKIRRLRTELEEREPVGAAASSEQAPPSDQPPAMPS